MFTYWVPNQNKITTKSTGKKGKGVECQELRRWLGKPANSIGSKRGFIDKISLRVNLNVRKDVFGNRWRLLKTIFAFSRVSHAVAPKLPHIQCRLRCVALAGQGRKPPHSDRFETTTEKNLLLRGNDTVVSTKGVDSHRCFWSQSLEIYSCLNLRAPSQLTGSPSCDQGESNRQYNVKCRLSLRLEAFWRHPMLPI